MCRPIDLLHSTEMPRSNPCPANFFSGDATAHYGDTEHNEMVSNALGLESLAIHSSHLVINITEGGLVCTRTTDVSTFGYPRGDIGVRGEYSHPPIYTKVNLCKWLLRRRNCTLHNWNEIELVENKCMYVPFHSHSTVPMGQMTSQCLGRQQVPPGHCMNQGVIL